MQPLLGRVQYCFSRKRMETLDIVLIRVNKNIKRDMFPLPRVDDILENLRLFCVYDSWHEGRRDYTAFRTISGSYRFKRSPQGLSTSPTAYQCACNLYILKQFIYIFIY